MKIKLTLPLTFQFNRKLKPEKWKGMDQVLQLHQLLKDLFQWRMDKKSFNLASHWAEHGASFQKISLEEIDFEDLMDKGEPSHYPSYRRTADPDRAYSDSFRLTRSRPNQLSSSFTPFGNQQMSDQEAPFFTIPRSFQEKTRIQGQKQDPFQPKAERVRHNDPSAVRLGERSTKEPEIAVHTSRINDKSKTPETNARRTGECSKFRCNQSCTLYDIAKPLQDVWKTTNIEKNSPYKSSGFREKQPFRVGFKDKPREIVAEVTNKKNSCHNCGSTDHYDHNCPKAKKKVYAIEKVPEEESPTEDSESDSMGDAIREQSDEEQDPREEFLVEYQEETPLEIQDIHLEAGIPQDTAKKNLCKHTQDAKTFLVTPTKGMAYMHGTPTKMTVCIDNSQHPLIIDSAAHCARVARNYLDHHSPN
ncbi:hypothetical protein O181_038966 [Austropuccinia psidii MF-1]|uniref:CCHC-type domain-containing protein n=1 Tax=Austropuccinia psidii MF-1 TaxID=1389203 RepID=A0A9Q3DF04_9BASI|nr:hypothetical protein [Austropuccinia psidii MF-1]